MKPVSINALIYRNYLTSSLVPIFTIEAVLLLLYFGINFYIADKNQATLLSEARANIQEIASREANAINKDLRAVNQLALMMQQDHQGFFSGPQDCHLPNGEPEFGVHDNGAYYKLKDNGGGSLYYSKTTTISAAEQRKARCSERMDPLLKTLVDINPIVTQAYFNSWDDLNRLYPFMVDAPSQYGAAINMEDYNFYYQADAKHNPERKPVWTGAYLDPAGQGWMLSIIVPIYRGDFLEGVSGLDVTIDSFVNNILNLHFPWDAGTFMVDNQGTILAMQPAIEKALGMKELGDHVYEGSVNTTVEKPEEYSILKLADAPLREQFARLFKGRKRVDTLTIQGVDYLISQEIVPETGWRMMTLIEQSRVFDSITRLKAMTNRIGYLAIGAMVGFYLIFFLYLLRKSGRLTQLIASPIENLSRVTQGLGENLRAGRIEPIGITEIDDLGHNFNTMAGALEERTDALVSAKLAAESASVAKSRFLTVISHEIRTPLNAIMGTSQVLISTPMEESDKKELLNTILKSGNALVGILNDMIDYANIDTQSLELKTARFDLGDSLQRFLEQVALKAKAKRLQLSLELAPALPSHIIADEKRLEQVLSNLMTNAIKFTASGGQVGLHLQAQEGSDEQLILQFTITDTGIGISSEQQNNLFLPFRQGDDSSERKYSGTGLGLALSKKVVELMGGRIWVESQLGEGSRFFFTLPLQRGHYDCDRVLSLEWDNQTAHSNSMNAREVAEAWQKLDKVTIMAAVGDLQAALESFSIDSSTVLGRLQELLTDTPFLAAVEEIEEHVAVYDFDQAQQVLEQFCAALGEDLKRD